MCWFISFKISLRQIDTVSCCLSLLSPFTVVCSVYTVIFAGHIPLHLSTFTSAKMDTLFCFLSVQILSVCAKKCFCATVFLKQFALLPENAFCANMNVTAGCCRTISDLKSYIFDCNLNTTGDERSACL